MLDAFRDATSSQCRCLGWVVADLELRLADYHMARDRAVGDMYGFTSDLARVDQPPTAELIALFGALVGNTSTSPGSSD